MQRHPNDVEILAACTARSQRDGRMSFGSRDEIFYRGFQVRHNLLKALAGGQGIRFTDTDIKSEPSGFTRRRGSHNCRFFEGHKPGKGEWEGSATHSTATAGGRRGFHQGSAGQVHDLIMAKVLIPGQVTKLADGAIESVARIAKPWNNKTFFVKFFVQCPKNNGHVATLGRFLNCRETLRGPQ